jgi:hypothetical protein
VCRVTMCVCESDEIILPDSETSLGFRNQNPKNPTCLFKKASTTFSIKNIAEDFRSNHTHVSLTERRKCPCWQLVRNVRVPHIFPARPINIRRYQTRTPRFVLARGSCLLCVCMCVCLRHMAGFSIEDASGCVDIMATQSKTKSEGKQHPTSMPE